MLYKPIEKGWSYNMPQTNKSVNQILEICKIFFVYNGKTDFFNLINALIKCFKIKLKVYPCPIFHYFITKAFKIT